jgi:transposase InsO family protein
LQIKNKRRAGVVELLAPAMTGWLKSKSQLIVENLCLRQQLAVLKRGQQRPTLRDPDRRFWIVVCRWFPRWREALIVVQPETVLAWHRKGWKAHWRRRSQRRRGGRHRIPPELRALIRRMARENALWGQQRIQAELARPGFRVCARTVAKYMRKPWHGRPSSGWRRFLAQSAKEIWACDFFTVQTIWFRTLYVFFVIDHGSREIVHAGVTAHPSAQWLAQQMVEACGFEREAPRYLIRDRDGCYGTVFGRRVRSFGIRQIRTPVRAPKANAIAERWIRTVRAECLDHVFIFGHEHLQRSLNEYVAYYNRWRPHRSLGQTAPDPPAGDGPVLNPQIVAEPVLGGLHHVYQFAA